MEAWDVIDNVIAIVAGAMCIGVVIVCVQFIIAG